MEIRNKSKRDTLVKDMYLFKRRYNNKNKKTKENNVKEPIMILQLPRKSSFH